MKTCDIGTDLFYTNIGKRLAKCRKQRRMTQEQVANKVNIGLNHYGKIENALNHPSLITLSKICHVLNCDIHYAIFGKTIYKEDLSYLDAYDQETVNLVSNLLENRLKDK